MPGGKHIRGCPQVQTRLVDASRFQESRTLDGVPVARAVTVPTGWVYQECILKTEGIRLTGLRRGRPRALTAARSAYPRPEFTCDTL